MTVEKAIKEIIEIEKETGLYIPVCWSKEDVESELNRTLSDSEWENAKRTIDKYSGISTIVLEEIESTL